MAPWGADGAFGLAGGCALIVGTAFVAAAAPGGLTGRTVVMAVAAAVLAGWISDWRAAAGVTVASVLVFAGFLAGHDGDLAAGGAAWAYAAVILVAGAAGLAWRHARVLLAARPSRGFVVRSIPRGARVARIR